MTESPNDGEHLHIFSFARNRLQIAWTETKLVEACSDPHH